MNQNYLYMENFNITAFDRVGGMKTLAFAVDVFYLKVLSDERISHFFRWVEMDKHTHKLKYFLANYLGAPIEYKGKSMKSAHAHLVDIGLNNEHYTIVAEHLLSTFKELGVPLEIVEDTKRLLEQTRIDILE